MASSDHGAQKPVRAKGSLKCPHHIGKKVVYVCENCKELACVTCVSKIHKGHELEDFGDIIRNARIKLQDFINKSEKHEIPRIKEKILDVDSEMSQKKKYYQQEIRQIEKQKEILMEELHKATKKLINSYRDMEKQDMEMLQNHKTSLQANVNDRNSQIKECKDTLQSGTDVQIYDVLCDLPSNFKETPTTSLTPSFTPGKFTLLQLQKLVGEITKRAPSADLHQKPHKDTGYSVISQFTPDKEHWIQSIHPLHDKKVWICLARSYDHEPTNKILTINHKGKIQQTLNIKEFVNDFCVGPQLDEIWFCNCEDGAVMTRQIKAGKGRSVARFRPQEVPGCICLTADDHLVIGHRGQVVKYTQQGNVICQSQGKKQWIVYPLQIAECPKTQNLAVIDTDRWRCGGKDKPVVCILDDQLNPLYKYSGDTPGDKSLTEKFNPSDLCYTANGSLVITDSSNKSVLLVSEKGEYQQTLYTYSGDSHPISVCVHNHGFLWLTFHDGSVQLLKME